MKPTLLILRGVPGSGKSKFAKTLTTLMPGVTCVAVSADDYFISDDGEYKFDATMLPEAHASCQSQCEQYMKMLWQFIIIDNTSTTEAALKPYYDLAAKHSYAVVSLVVENRHGGKDIHGVPYPAKQRMATQLFASIKLI